MITNKNICNRSCNSYLSCSQILKNREIITLFSSFLRAHTPAALGFACGWMESVAAAVTATCSTPPQGVRRTGSKHGKGARAKRTCVSCGKPAEHKASPVPDWISLLTTDESLSLRLFIRVCTPLHLCFSPPHAGKASVCFCTFWIYFRLTFRVSLRFISLFSSISSCSLRAEIIRK